MAANLVSVVMQFLTPDMIAKIASALGLDRSRRAKGDWRRDPCTACGSGGRGFHAQGARQLTNTLAQQQPGSLESLKSLIGGSGQNNLAETGSSMLSGLFGGGALDTMAQAIGKFAGARRGTPASRYSVCSALWSSGRWVNSSAARAWMQAGWRRFSARKKIRSPRRFRPAWPIS